VLSIFLDSQNHAGPCRNALANRPRAAGNPRFPPRDLRSPEGTHACRVTHPSDDSVVTSSVFSQFYVRPQLDPLDEIDSVWSTPAPAPAPPPNRPCKSPGRAFSSRFRGSWETIRFGCLIFAPLPSPPPASPQPVDSFRPGAYPERRRPAGPACSENSLSFSLLWEIFFHVSRHTHQIPLNPTLARRENWTGRILGNR